MPVSDIKLDVRVYPIDEPKGGTMAFASVAVDDMAAIRGIRVVDSEKGLFVSMPQSKDKNDEYHDIAFPLTGELRKEITAAVLEEYERAAALSPDARDYGTQEASGSSGKSVADVRLDIRVYPLDEPQGSTKAFASVSMNDLIAIRGIRLVEGTKGVFAAMPQSKDKDGGYHDIAFPLSGDLRKEINKLILTEFKSMAKTADKSLADGLKKGAEKAAGQQAPDAAQRKRNATEH
jgi:stage V sporulation protein G